MIKSPTEPDYLRCATVRLTTANLFTWPHSRSPPNSPTLDQDPSRMMNLQTWFINTAIPWAAELKYMLRMAPSSLSNTKNAGDESSIFFSISKKVPKVLKPKIGLSREKCYAA